MKNVERTIMAAGLVATVLVVAGLLASLPVFAQIAEALETLEHIGCPGSTLPAAVDGNVTIASLCIMGPGSSVSGNVMVPAGAILTIFSTATVNGNVSVLPAGLLLVGNGVVGLAPGGTIDGNIEATGGDVGLGDGATVNGDVIQEGPVAPGGTFTFIGPFNVYFFGITTGATVFGNVEMKDGGMSALTAFGFGVSATNFVDGNIKCDAPGTAFPSGAPFGGPADWDGDGTVDGGIGGNYEC